MTTSSVPSPGMGDKSKYTHQPDLSREKQKALGDAADVDSADMLSAASTSSGRRAPRPTGTSLPSMLSPDRQQQMLDSVVSVVRSETATPSASQSDSDTSSDSSAFASSSSSGSEGEYESLARYSGEIIDSFTLVARSSGKAQRRKTFRDQTVLAGSRPHHLKQDVLPWISNIFRAGSRGDRYIQAEFRKLITDSEHITPEQKAALIKGMETKESEAEQHLTKLFETQTDKPELREGGDQILMPDKNTVAEFKTLTKGIQSSVHEHLRGTAVLYGQLAFDKDLGLSTEALEEVKAFVGRMQKEAAGIEGEQRFAIIHEQAEWDPEKGVQRYMAFFNPENGRNMMVRSIFRALGPGYSSQAPRNRTLDNAFVPNFFDTSIVIDDKGDGSLADLLALLDLSASRSAITNEFSQQDKGVRIAVNHKLVLQVLTGHAGKKLSKMTWEEMQRAASSGDPIVLTSQTVNLLTPDRLRTMAVESMAFRDVAGKIHHGLSGSPADDERTLALENLEVYRKFNGQTIMLEVVNTAGEKLHVPIKFDLRYFNIPNNVMHEKMPEFLTFSEELQAENNESWKKLEGDSRQQLDKLRAQFVEGVKDLPLAEQAKLLEVWDAQVEKTRSREKVMLKTIRSGSLSKTSKAFKEWQQEADELSNMIRDLKNNPDISLEMKKQLAIIEAYSMVADLYLDTRELYLSGMSGDLSKMDNNRSALATRMIALGMILEDVEVHFGCRSGKDRTGLVDIELKLLFATAMLIGRMPSYREQERLPYMTAWRETMTMESGNVDAIVKANMGARMGINTGGSASRPLEVAEAGKKMQHDEFTQASQAFAGAASRPMTDRQVEASHQEYFRDLPIVITR